jgi:hypothetical protein
MIKPTIGRVVWFTPSKYSDLPSSGGQALVALIVHVHSDKLVNLAVFDSNGYQHPVTSVDLIQDGEQKPVEGGYCEWMPYQKGQAAKTEKAEAALKEPDPLPIRLLTDHKVNFANEDLAIAVMDGPGAGGANHHYHISGFNTETNPSCPFQKRHGQPARHATILFQNGPIQSSGVNGITHEVLIAILIDRLRSFQAGPYACEENADALINLVNAQLALHSRTQRRQARGVEGTHTV